MKSSFMPQINFRPMVRLGLGFLILCCLQGRALAQGSVQSFMDTTPPSLIWAQLSSSVPNQVTVTFSEPVNPFAGMDPFNYALFDGDLSGSAYYAVEVNQIGTDLTAWGVVFETPGSGEFTPNETSVMFVFQMIDLADNIGFDLSAPVHPAPVPEPSAALLALLTALVCLIRPPIKRGFEV